MGELEHPGVRKVVAGLAEAGMPDAAAGVLILPDAVRTAAAAASALGVDVGAIANSLVFRAIRDVGGATEVTPLLVMTSGAHRANEAVLAELADVDRIAKADADFVRAHTGQPIGGVAPIGHAEPIPTLVDQSLADYPVLWAAAGHPKSVFPLTFPELVRLTGGRVGNVSAPERADRHSAEEASASQRPVPERPSGNPSAGTGRGAGWTERSASGAEEASASQRPVPERPSGGATGGEDDR